VAVVRVKTGAGGVVDCGRVAWAAAGAGCWGAVWPARLTANAT